MIKSCEQSQPAPQHTKRSRPVHPVLLEILAQQRAKGLSEYGTELHSHNGRAALLDALQEAVDGLHYLTQELMEAWDRIAELEAALCGLLSVTLTRDHQDAGETIRECIVCGAEWLEALDEPWHCENCEVAAAHKALDSSAASARCGDVPTKAAANSSPPPR